MFTRASEQTSTARSDRERAELIRGVYRNLPVGVAGALVGVGLLCWILLYIAPDRAPQVAIWLAATLLVAAWQIGLWAWHRRARPPDRDWRIWGRRFVLASFAEGVRWGAGTLFLAAPGHPDQQIWVCLVVACTACSSVSSLGSYIPAFYALLFPAMVPYVIWAPFQGNVQYTMLALMAAVLTSSIAVLGYGQSRSLAEALRLRFENLDLAEDLRLQKEQAEQANQAKTRFLAAAGHDLRQPIHALGMSVAALSRFRLGQGMGRLVQRITSNVEALSDLFDSLLDISQLDAGVVRSKPETFPIHPMLERICAEQAGELQGRPVTLRLVRSTAFAHTDPVLLERMLRNVIANAVRHTREGRILVGCRAGERLTIETHDTGPGIPPELQELVFQEYYQAGNPERDRAKGLGLGLSITRRLAVLLACPISLESVAGRGTTFRISAPRADAADWVEPQAPPVSERRGMIFVVDDETAVRQGTADLLGAWGYEAVTAGSGDELLARATPEVRPDLLICDLRLRGTETATSVAARVRERFGDDVPVLLITGDTEPSRLREAHASGFALLHKPAPPGKLRAAIGNLARASRGTAP